jgi:small GTP-binding protein
MTTRDSSLLPGAAPGTASGRTTYKGKVVVVGDYSSGKTTLVHRYSSGQYLGISEPTIAAAFQTKMVDLALPAEVPRTVSWPGEPGVIGRSFEGQERVSTAAGSAAATSSTVGGKPPQRSRTRSSRDGPCHEPRDCVVKLEIWDTAGSERYQSLMPMYFRDAVVALLVFDVTRRSTFVNVQRWLEAYQHHNDRRNAPLMRAILVAAKADLYSAVAEGDPSKELGGPDRFEDSLSSKTARSMAFGKSASVATWGDTARSTGRREHANEASPPCTGSSVDVPEVTIAEALRLGEELGLPVCFTSAKANWNVGLLFRDVATHIAAVSDQLVGPRGFGLRNGMAGSPGSLLLRDDVMRREYESREGRGARPDGDDAAAGTRRRKCGCT